MTNLNQVCEGWSLTGVFIPAVEHHVVNFSIAVLRLLQPLPLPHLLHHLTARHAGVGSGAQGHDLPHQHAVRPDVSFPGVGYQLLVLILKLSTYVV